MSREFRSPTPNEASAEYWDGHFSDDSCRGRMKERFYNPFSYSPMRNYAAKILSDYLKTSEQIPLKTFRDGGTFRLDDYPAGTIIRISGEGRGSIPQKAERNEHYERRSGDWGVVVEHRPLRMPKRNFVISFMPDPIITDEGLMVVSEGIFKVESMTPGVVGHDKFDSRRGHIDSYIRYTKLELHMMGKTAPERQKKRETVLTPIVDRL